MGPTSAPSPKGKDSGDVGVGDGDGGVSGGLLLLPLPLLLLRATSNDFPLIIKSLISFRPFLCLRLVVFRVTPMDTLIPLEIEEEEK